MKNESDFLKLLRQRPDATFTRRRGPEPARKVQIPKQPQPTIGAARESMSVPTYVPKGEAQELNPQHGVTAGDLASLIVPVRAGFKAGQATRQALKQGSLGRAAVTALAASPMMLPEGGPIGKFVGKIGGKVLGPILRSFADDAVSFENLPERFAIFTAENPGGAATSKEANEASMKSLKNYLDRRGITYTRGLGRYQDNTTGNVLNENSLIAHNVGEREAKLIGKRYGQNGVITQGGYHDLTTGQTFPVTGKPGLATDLPYTELPNGQRFALPIDWENPVQSKVNALPVPKGFNPEIARITKEMNERSGGRNLPRVKAVDPEAARHMANVYEGLPANDPEARASYDALNKEVEQQYKDLEAQGFKFEFVNEDPYKSSKEMMEDVRKNRRLKVFATPGDAFHPYMTPEQNNHFRAVHDLLAHAGEGHQFGAKGEENAFRVHMSTLSPAAQRALATETRGQNSWVNFGPNAHLPVGQRPFAEQKAALWPTSLLGDYHEMPIPQAADVSNADMFKNMLESGFAGGVPNTGVLLPTSGAGRSGTTTAAMAAARKLTTPEQLRNLISAEVASRGGASSPEVEMAAGEQVARDIASNGAPRPARASKQLQPERINGGGYNVVADSAAATPLHASVRSLNQYLGFKPTKDAVGAAQTFKDTPKAIRARANAAWEAAHAPVPTDRPRPAGVIMDRSGIKPDEGVSGPLPVRQPFGPRAASGQLKGVGSDEQLALTKAQIERGERMMPSTFYPSARSFLDAVGNAGGDVPMFHNATTAAAIRSGVPDEIVSGQSLYWAMKQGIVSPEEIAAAKDSKTMEALMRKVRDAHAAQVPGAQRLRLMGAHGTAFNNLNAGTSGAYKIPLYGDQKLGNVPGSVLDTHGAKSNTVFSPFSRYFANEGAFSNPEYGVVEARGLRPVASELGISDRRAQEAQWRGAGNFTGLRTPPNQDYGQIAENLVLNHARLTNQSPQRAMERIARGQEPLFFPKKQLSLFDQ